MKSKRIAILHYTAPPVVGGVEAVIEAHSKILAEKDFSVTIIAGRGKQEALHPSVQFIKIPLFDSQNSVISEINNQLERGEFPSNFDQISILLENKLAPILKNFDHIIVHNIFTKHFNLPLTVAIHNLIDRQIIQSTIAWCHDFTWTSPNSRCKVFPGYPWDLLRTYREDIQYVVVSKKRQKILSELFKIPDSYIKVIYNGIDPFILLGISPEGRRIIQRLGLLQSDLNIIMPVRITQAKNIEYALLVLAQLKSLGVSPKLVLTGPPDPHDAHNLQYFNSLKSLRSDLGLENDMHFIYESGLEPNQPYTINNVFVGDLFRVSDIMFMPSHREGFGMPVLEAGMLGLPVISTPIPSSEEIAGNDAVIFELEQTPRVTATQIIEQVNSNPLSHLRMEIRKKYTWEAIFHNQIIPLLDNQMIEGLFGPQEAKKRLNQAKRLWLFLDYDGTLADFAPTPNDVLPDSELINILDNLQQDPQIQIAIVSGRRLDHVLKIVPVPGILIAGTYGVEIQDFEGKRINRMNYEQARQTLDSLKPKFKELLRNHKGFFLEDKGWSLAIHARYASETASTRVISKAYQLSANNIDEKIFQIIGGDKFFEVVPKIANKGTTIRYLFETYPFSSALPVFIGDDDKDEQAFSVIEQLAGIPIIVSKEARETNAMLRFNSPQTVRNWLKSKIRM